MQDGDEQWSTEGKNRARIWTMKCGVWRMKNAV